MARCRVWRPQALLAVNLHGRMACYWPLNRTDQLPRGEGAARQWESHPLVSSCAAKSAWKRRRERFGLKSFDWLMSRWLKSHNVMFLGGTCFHVLSLMFLQCAFTECMPSIIIDSISLPSVDSKVHLGISAPWADAPNWNGLKTIVLSVAIAFLGPKTRLTWKSPNWNFWKLLDISRNRPREDLWI